MRGRAREQRGFTLIEMLIAASMALIVLTATLAVLLDGTTDSTSAITRAQSIQTAEAGIRQMDQELDQAYAVESPTSTSNTGCPATSGVQGCSIADVLVRLTSTGQSGTDFELRYDCTVASTTITADRACWRYLCSASASTATGSSCTATSGTLLSKRVVIDDLTNGTSANPVFSFCYPNSATTGSSCASGATRPTSATVTVEVPSAGTLPSAAAGDPSTVMLTGGVYMPNLDLDQ
jgi:prepilin-type N-terminal cleavage/methylation domain-containing protein